MVKSFKKDIVVSICMITYNHEAYIKQAIEGVCIQQTNFKVELIIADDCSTDQTEKVIREEIKKHPDTISVKYTRQRKNLGMMPNFIAALQQCTGKYIALCEGDDYWTDPLKLQKQVDFLEANPEFSICFHPVKIFNQNTLAYEKDTITRDVDEITDVHELCKGNYIHTPSVVLRNDFTIPSWFDKVHLGDWSLYMLSIKGKKIFKFREEMGVYRLHSQSIWSKHDQEKRNSLTQENVRMLLKNLKSNTTVKNILKRRIQKKGIKHLVIKLVKKMKRFLKVQL